VCDQFSADMRQNLKICVVPINSIRMSIYLIRAYGSVCISIIVIINVIYCNSLIAVIDLAEIK